MGRVKDFLIAETEKYMEDNNIPNTKENWAECTYKVTHNLVLKQAKKDGTPTAYCGECGEENPIRYREGQGYCQQCGWEVDSKPTEEETMANMDDSYPNEEGYE